jgi:hypothetical protein
LAGSKRPNQKLKKPCPIGTLGYFSTKTVEDLCIRLYTTLRPQLSSAPPTTCLFFKHNIFYVEIQSVTQIRAWQHATTLQTQRMKNVQTEQLIEFSREIIVQA